MQSGHSGSRQIGRQHALSLAKSVTFRFCGMFQRACAGPSSWMTSSRSLQNWRTRKMTSGSQSFQSHQGQTRSDESRSDSGSRARSDSADVDTCSTVAPRRTAADSAGRGWSDRRELLQEGRVGIGRRRLQDDVALEQELADVAEDLLVDQPALPPPREP